MNIIAEKIFILEDISLGDIIYKESFLDLKDAHTREKYFKTSSGRRFLKSKIFNC